MKLYKKSDLTFKHNMLVTNDNEVVAIDNEIVDLFNVFETNYQKACYMMNQPDPVPERSIDGFNRKHSGKHAELLVPTPRMDAKVNEALALMDELDNASVLEEANEILRSYQPIVDFIRDDEVLGIDGQFSVHKFDTPMLENPLELTMQDLIQAALIIASVRKDNYDFDYEIDSQPLSEQVDKMELQENAMQQQWAENFKPEGVDPYESEQEEGNASRD